MICPGLKSELRDTDNRRRRAARAKRTKQVLAKPRRQLFHGPTAERPAAARADPGLRQICDRGRAPGSQEGGAGSRSFTAAVVTPAGPSTPRKQYGAACCAVGQTVQIVFGTAVVLVVVVTRIRMRAGPRERPLLGLKRTKPSQKRT